MNKVPSDHILREMPPHLRRFLGTANLYDSSCSPEANVYFIDKGSGYYLKHSARGTLENEWKMTRYFYSKQLGAEVIDYICAESDWLLTAAVLGQNCLHETYLADPKRLCDTLAAALRGLHETDPAGCPVPNRTAQYLAAAESNYRAGKFDGSLFAGGFGWRSAEKAHAALAEGKGALQSRVLLHGDYCLPNVILNDWRLSGFIDVGCGGVGDRHIDLFWGVWTLWFNLKTDRYCGRFLDAYGRDLADASVLKIVAAAEVFG